MKQVYLINPSAANAKKAFRFIRKNKYTHHNLLLVKNKTRMFTSYVQKGVTHFVICGGDGTINNVITEYMKLSKNIRSKMIFSLFPCGTANDLSRELSKSFIRSKTRTMKIDLIKINQDYILTGGGTGFISEVVQSLESGTSKFIQNRVFKSMKYYFHALKKIIVGYDGSVIKSINGKPVNKKCMFVAFNNQITIGKHFHLSPHSSQDDGGFYICICEKGNSMLKGLDILKKVVRGTHITDELVTYQKYKTAKIILNKKQQIMGDGELLKPNQELSLQIIPKEVTFSQLRFE